MKVQIQATSKLLVIIALIFSAIGLKAQNISHIKTAKSWHYIYDAKKTKPQSVSTVGKVVSVTGDTFVSQVGSWLYTWSKEGKNISTRPARR